MRRNFPLFSSLMTIKILNKEGFYNSAVVSLLSEASKGNLINRRRIWCKKVPKMCPVSFIFAWRELLFICYNSYATNSTKLTSALWIYEPYIPHLSHCLVVLIREVSKSQINLAHPFHIIVYTLHWASKFLETNFVLTSFSEKEICMKNWCVSLQILTNIHLCLVTRHPNKGVFVQAK